MTDAPSKTPRELSEENRKLREENEELRETLRRRDQFVATVTHELKTPIHGILGLAELLQDDVYGAINDRQDEALDGMSRAATRLLSMVQNLLQFERALAGTVEVHPETVDLMDLVEKVIESSAWAAIDKELTIEVDVDVETAHTDKRLLRHVLSNLIANGMRFTPPNGRVEVVIRDQEESLSIEVSDQGPGLAEHELEAIFDEFWQVKESARAFGGGGLGLVVVGQIVDRLGGELEVESEEGTTFRVQLPVVASDGP